MFLRKRCRNALLFFVVYLHLNFCFYHEEDYFKEYKTRAAPKAKRFQQESSDKTGGQPANTFIKITKEPVKTNEYAFYYILWHVCLELPRGGLF